MTTSKSNGPSAVGFSRNRPITQTVFFHNLHMTSPVNAAQQDRNPYSTMASVESEVARHLGEIQTKLLENSVSREGVVAYHMRACFEAFVSPIRQEFYRRHPDGIPVLIGKHFAVIFIDTMSKNGIGQPNFLDLKMAHNPEFPKPDSPFVLEYGEKIAEFERLLQREIKLSETSDALMVWSCDRCLHGAAGEEGAILRLLGPRHSKLLRDFPDATDSQVETIIISYVDACRLRLDRSGVGSLSELVNPGTQPATAP